VIISVNLCALHVSVVKFNHIGTECTEKHRGYFGYVLNISVTIETVLFAMFSL